MIVVDAAAVHDFLLDDGPRGSWAIETLAHADSVHAPHLIDYEVVSSIRRRTLAREIPLARAEQALDVFALMSLQRHALKSFLARIWELRARLSAYDAAYVALAEALRAPLVTTDSRLARAHGHRAEIRVPS